MAKNKNKNKKPATDERTKPPAADEAQRPQTPAADKTEETDERPAEDNDKSVNVVVEVYHAIAFDGVHISPKIDDPRGGKRPTIKPVKAVIPRALAESFGDKYVKIITSAPHGAKVGLVAD